MKQSDPRVSQQVYGRLNYKPSSSAAHFLQTPDERCCLLYAKVKAEINKKSPRVQILSFGLGESVLSGRSSTRKPFLAPSTPLRPAFPSAPAEGPLPVLAQVTPGQPRSRLPAGTTARSTKWERGSPPKSHGLQTAQKYSWAV